MLQRFERCSLARFWFIVGVLLFLPSSLLAAPDASKTILTLEDLIDLAIQNSPKIREAESKLAMACSDLDQVKAAFFPQLQVRSVAGPIDDAKTPVIKNNRIHDPSDSGIGIFGRLDFIVTQPLYLFGKLSNREEAARFGINASKHQPAIEKADIIYRVKELYYALVLARQGVAAADEADQFFSDTRERISRVLAAGGDLADETDLYKFEAYHSEVKGFRAQAVKGVAVTYFGLKQMINMPRNEEFDIQEADLADKFESLNTFDEYIQQAIANRPELLALRDGIEASRFMVEAVKSDLYPSFYIAAMGSAAGAPDRERFDQAYFHDEFNHAYAGIVAGMTWEFDFGIKKAKVAKEQARYRQLKHTLSYAEQNIPIEVANYYREVIQWQQSATAFSKAYRAARKWVFTAFANFDMGTGTAQDMFDALDRYGKNRGNYIEALYNYNLARANLERAIGRLE